VKRTHRHADARSHFVAGHGRGQETLAGDAAFQLGERDERGQRGGANVHRALAVNVVELEALDERAVQQCGARRRYALVGAPQPAELAVVHRHDAFDGDLAVLLACSVDTAAQRIEDEELDALAHFRGNLLVGEPRDELRDFLRVSIVRLLGLGAFVFHCCRCLCHPLVLR
jgi:hypothetical protein